MASAGGTVTIAFTTDKEWTAKTDASWLKLGASSGSKGENTLQVTVEAYDGDVDRTADVTITCGKDSKKLTVTQKAKDPGDDPGDDPGSEPIPGEGDELPCLSPPTVGTVDQTALVGYGAGVTGGEGSGSQVLHFDNGKALQTWLLQRTKDEKKGTHTPTVIWLSGTFKSDDGRDFSEAHPWFDVKDVSNLSFIGTDTFVMDKIGIFCVRANNIIIRNINFQQPKANNGADAVSMQDCDGVWVDHCTLRLHRHHPWFQERDRKLVPVHQDPEELPGRPLQQPERRRGHYRHLPPQLVRGLQQPSPACAFWYGACVQQPL